MQWFVDGIEADYREREGPILIWIFRLIIVEYCPNQITYHQYQLNNLEADSMKLGKKPLCSGLGCITFAGTSHCCPDFTSVRVVLGSFASPSHCSHFSLAHLELCFLQQQLNTLNRFPIHDDFNIRLRVLLWMLSQPFWG